MSLTEQKRSATQYEDREIIHEVIAGNIPVFEMLIRRYNPYLYKIGRSYGFNHHDTEDLMQETFISSYINLRQFAERSSFKTWLVKIMLGQCYRKSQKLSFQNEHPTEFLSDNSPSMFLQNDQTEHMDQVARREFNNVVEASLQKLPEDYRITFVLRELTGLSIAETSELMNATTANVKVRLNRAKIMLRKEIEKTYGPKDIFEFNLVYCDGMVAKVMKHIMQPGVAITQEDIP